MAMTMDVCRDYNQIKMALEDQEKTAFITPFGIYCFKSRLGVK